MADYLETGESVWCINCGHHFNEHILTPTDSPSVLYHGREYLGCKGMEEGRIECECKKFTPYQINPEKVRKVVENTEPEDKENSGRLADTSENSSPSCIWIVLTSWAFMWLTC